MTLSEKSAYLKGLMEGMKLDTETNEGKLISEIISMLQDVAENVSDLEEVVDCISDELDCIEEDLDNIDDYLLDDEDDDDLPLPKRKPLLKKMRNTISPTKPMTPAMTTATTISCTSPLRIWVSS